MAINKIKTIAIEDDAVLDTKIATNQVGISELKVSDGTTGQILSTNGSGTLSFISVSTDNDYVDSLAFTTSSGLLTLGRTSPLSDLTYNLDGRYALLGQVLTNVPSGALFTDTIYTHPTSDGNLHVPATGTSNSGKVLTAGSTAGSLSWSSDTDNYADALSWNTSTGVLTVGRTGSLANLTIDLDGRYSLTDNNSYVNSATFSSASGDFVLGFGGSGSLGNITTNLDGRYHPIDSTSTPSVTFKENIQDIVGSMVTSNTETGIAVSYDDATGSTGTGKLNFTISNATTSVDGSMSSSDKAKLDGVADGADVTNITGGTGITSSGDFGNITVSITDSGVGNTQMADNAIGNAEMRDDAVGADELIDTAVTAASYTLTNITVDAQGRITAASSGAASGSKGMTGSTSAQISGLSGTNNVVACCTHGGVFHNQTGITWGTFQISGGTTSGAYDDVWYGRHLGFAGSTPHTGADQRKIGTLGSRGTASTYSCSVGYASQGGSGGMTGTSTVTIVAIQE